MKKRTQKDIIKKALSKPGCSSGAEIMQNGVWIPVSADVYEKIKELLNATGSGTRPLKGDWRLGCFVLKRGEEHALAITSADVPEILKEEFDADASS